LCLARLRGAVALARAWALEGTAPSTAASKEQAQDQEQERREPSPPLSTAGETLTIEEVLTLRADNGERRTWRRSRMELEQWLRLLPPAAKTSTA
jgi:hypothetical protein